MQSQMAYIIDALCSIRCGADDTEEELHAQVSSALAAAGICAVHEASLAPRCRIDFLAGDIGIEIKKRRPDRAGLLAQLTRYAACEQIAQLLVVAPRGVSLPKEIGRKPVTVLALERLWGIFLP